MDDLALFLSLTDRMAVLNGGRLSRPLRTADADPDELGLLMGGVHGEGEAPPPPVSRQASDGARPV